MRAAEFAAWTEPTILSFAEDLARANGVRLDVTLPLARAQFTQLFADGPEAPQTWLFCVVDDEGADVGTLWLGVNPQLENAGFVYDIAIDEARRGQGLGRAAMLLAEDVLRDAGYRQIQLSVFGFNNSAQALYESLGYDVVATTMAKPLDR